MMRAVGAGRPKPPPRPRTLKKSLAGFSQADAAPYRRMLLTITSTAPPVRSEHIGNGFSGHVICVLGQPEESPWRR